MTALIEPGHPGWATLITASKVSAVLGLSPWESPRSLWHRMRGELPPVDQTSAMARGLFLEDGIVRWFYADNPHLEQLGKRTVTRPDLPWAAGTPDCVARDRDTGELIPVDAKTDARDTFGTPGTDEVPLPYVCQAMFVMHLGGWERFIFTRLGPFLERDEYEVAYDPALALEIEERCEAFYRSLSGDVPPDLDDTLATYEALRAVSTVGDGDWECPPAIARELCEARTGLAAAEARHNLARSVALEAMGDARRIVCAGQVLGQKQPTKSGKPALYPPRKAVDLDALPLIDSLTTESETAA